MYKLFVQALWAAPLWHPKGTPMAPQREPHGIISSGRLSQLRTTRALCNHTAVRAPWHYYPRPRPAKFLQHNQLKQVSNQCWVNSELSSVLPQLCTFGFVNVMVVQACIRIHCCCSQPGLLSFCQQHTAYPRPEALLQKL